MHNKHIMITCTKNGFTTFAMKMYIEHIFGKWFLEFNFWFWLMDLGFLDMDILLPRVYFVKIDNDSSYTNMILDIDVDMVKFNSWTFERDVCQIRVLVAVKYTYLVRWHFPTYYKKVTMMMMIILIIAISWWFYWLCDDNYGSCLLFDFEYLYQVVKMIVHGYLSICSNVFFACISGITIFPIYIS